MQDQKCRNCGGTLKPTNKCPICKNPTQFRCPKCKDTSEEQLHINCKPSKLVGKIIK